LDKSISRSSGRLSTSLTRSPTSLKEEMLRVQLINHLTSTLFSHPSVFGSSDSRASMEIRIEREGSERVEKGENGIWGEGWGWSFQGPKFSVKSEEDKLENTQHTQYAHFQQHRHMYAQLVRALQVFPFSLFIIFCLLFSSFYLLLFLGPTTTASNSRIET